MNILAFAVTFFAAALLVNGQLPGDENVYCFKSICSSNPMGNPMRGFDEYGAGFYGAPRGLPKTHKGLDIVCEKDDEVRAPFKAKILRTMKPFGDKDYEISNNGIVFQGVEPDKKDWEIILWYVIPLPDIIGQTVEAGEAIGNHPSLQEHTDFGKKMTDHVHLEMYIGGKIENPMKYTCVEKMLKGEL